MPSRLSEAHIRANTRLQELVSAGVGRAWTRLPGYDRRDVEAFLRAAVPLVAAGQRRAVALTEAFLAAALDRPPVGVDVSRVTGAAVRNGVPPEVVYERPFVTVWTALKAGSAWDDAVNAGLSRARASAEMDVQLSMRETLREVGAADDTLWGYRRVANAGACAYCTQINGAQFLKSDPMPLHPACVTADTVVSGGLAPAHGRAESADFARVHAATRRWYVGELVLVETSAGHKLAVTPNHPILTDRGWVQAGFLREGDSVISGGAFERVTRGVPNEQDIPTRIEDRFSAGAMFGVLGVPFAAEHFHGDSGEGEVNVVSVDRRLDARGLASLFEPTEHQPFGSGLRDALAFSCTCGGAKRLRAVRMAALRRMCGSRSRLPLRRRHVRGDDAGLLACGPFRDGRLTEMAFDHATLHAVTLGKAQDGFAGQVSLTNTNEFDAPRSRNAALAQFADKGRLADADGGRRLGRALAGQVELDSVFHLRRVGWSGHVYNLLTADGWYAANGIVTHNCRCGVEPVPYTRGRRNRPDRPPEGVAVRDHGELGPLVGDPSHDFTSVTDI